MQPNDNPPPLNVRAPTASVVEYATIHGDDVALYRLLRLLVGWSSLLGGSFATIGVLAQLWPFLAAIVGTVTYASASVRSPDLMLLVARSACEAAFAVGGAMVLGRSQVGANIICIAAIAKAVVAIANPFILYMTNGPWASIYTTPPRLTMLIAQTMSGLAPLIVLAVLTLPRIARRYTR